MEEKKGLNKGDWSEVYAFFQLLAEGKLYAAKVSLQAGNSKIYTADASIRKIAEKYYPILKILAEQSRSEYVRNDNIKVIDLTTKKCAIEIPAVNFEKQAKMLYDVIKESEGYFTVPNTEKFMQSIHYIAPKSGSNTKRDITIKVHDFKTGIDSELGFSIKSFIGGAPTLLNASGPTNFTYKISGPFSTEKKERTNSINTRPIYKNRLEEIEKLGGKIEFYGLENASFSVNLQMVDTLLPQMLAFMLLKYYKGEAKTAQELTQILSEENPFGYDQTLKQPIYQHKIKNFLADIALGMRPNTPFSGNYDASGGAIIVKQNGEIACFYIYDISDLKDYLMQTTVFEKPDSRVGYGKVYENGGNYYIKLNLQIRFF